MQLIAEIAFKEKGKEDPDLIVIACDMLAQMAKEPVKIEDPKPQDRVPNEEPMWENLMILVTEHFSTNNSGASFVIQSVVDLIFKVK